jgi:NADPH:quinone reductase-like Zn-dependent oxidoreductase
MKIATARQYGSPDVVRIEEIETPKPEADEVLVRVHAASVNRADLDGLYPRWQFLRLFLGIRRPRLPWLGIDVAGTVEAVGPEVTELKPGDRVFGDIFGRGRKTGAFAEYACVSQKALATMPAALDFAEAACLPHAACLAILALTPRRGRDFGNGSDVMIIGASGNVGPYCVQIAKARGATVTAVASGPKLDFVRSLGADTVIDYKTTDYTSTGTRFDLIIDVDAHHGAMGWRRSLKPGGIYCAMGGSLSWLLSSVAALPVSLATGKSMGLLMGWRPFPPAAVAEMKELVAAGVIKPHVDRTYVLEEAADALRWVDQGKATGKVVINMEQP